MNDRTCIVTRRQAEADELIRFVVGPDSAVVPDIKRNLPGRGCWVTADRLHIEKAAAKNLFARAFKAQVTVPSDLGGMVDGLLSRYALGMLGLARKAGAVVLGAAKVEGAVRDGQASLVLHAAEASDDGVRKISQARRATVHLGGSAILAYKLFSEAELSLALGGTNVIHAAVLAQDAGLAVEKRVVALDRYRGGTPNDLAMLAAVADEDDAAEDME
ncbi:RNA-binding protein [Mesorhizobium sp. M2A.F.Ca.ET.043.05.1.1]|uniref:RNA-binding protein n=1 Tax=Mesorhizobium sp. M2A.F.Ca.ET.043.05.1.1 TaxID=2493671 RepID=UPI000F755E7D|nr:RNA-binding protein [Mesorhizobium sp. M2A.F.Ca.ET.043.05.1.1]AZO19180.1 RNA-binding protein [Mesorhizobium sp. M2A.F.Ca.ET.043.05.1.1]